MSSLVITFLLLRKINSCMHAYHATILLTITALNKMGLMQNHGALQNFTLYYATLQ